MGAAHRYAAIAVLIACGGSAVVGPAKARTRQMAQRATGCRRTTGASKGAPGEILVRPREERTCRFLSHLIGAPV